MRVIKDKSVIDDEWSLIRELDSSASIPEGSAILPFSFWYMSTPFKYLE